MQTAIATKMCESSSKAVLEVAMTHEKIHDASSTVASFNINTACVTFWLLLNINVKLLSRVACRMLKTVESASVTLTLK